MNDLGRRRSRAIALTALLAASAVHCAAIPRAPLPLPNSAPITAASSSASGAVAAPPAEDIEADFVIDAATSVQASVDDVHAMLLAENSLTHVLPYTRSAALIGAIDGRERHVRLVQGTSLVNIEYTLHVEDEGAVVRFTLEKAHPHGIADCQGFFELTAETPTRTRVRFVDAVDLGSGVARIFFKEQIRKSAMTTPTLVRKFMEAGKPLTAPPPNGNE